ncbi:MAG: LPXTG cell wall anchor domain-containing protein, partial [Oscillospiraceae bacterium]
PDKEKPTQTASPTPSPTPTPKPTPTVSPTPTEEPVDVKGEKKGFPWLLVVGVAAVVGGGVFWVARKRNSDDEE